MKKIEVRLPQMGEGIIEAQITRWLIDLNEKVEPDDALVEIATDKVDSEIPSPVSGVLVKTFYSENETAKVGDVLAIIESSSEDSDEMEGVSPQLDINKNTDVDSIEDEVKEVINETSNLTSQITPFIRHYGNQRGISFDELKQIKGSGEGGEIVTDDVQQYFKKKVFEDRKDTPTASSEPIFKPPILTDKEVEYVLKEGEEAIEVSRMRQLIAEQMVKSVSTIPHVTSTVEVDITKTVLWREKAKKDFKESHGVNLTYTSIIVEQVVKALQEYPLINVSYINNQIILKKYFNIGIATALKTGDLIVPVIKRAESMNLSGIAVALDDLTKRARDRKLKLGEANGGTFTITNLGMFNNIAGTPIINHPEAAILAVGAIKKRSWVVEENGTQAIAIRDILTLSLSYDHRIIDGALGGAFLNRIGELLETDQHIS